MIETEEALFEAARIERLFSLENTIAADIFRGKLYPWEILSELCEFIIRLGNTLSEEEYVRLGEDIWAAKDADIAPSAVIKGPCIIDKGAEIRHCAFIRGSAVIGKNAVVGNSSEIKNALLFDGAQTPHFNYVGDSVLGCKSHLGAGAVTSNLKSDKTPVEVKYAKTAEKLATGRKKAGAFIGDNVEVGCGAVLCPGTVIGRGSTVYPLSCVRGFVPENRIFKDADRIVLKTSE